jgi:hypothetical protein
MKRALLLSSLLLVAAIAVAAGGVATSEGSAKKLRTHFEAWKMKFGKVYTSAEAHTHAFEAFKENVMFLETHNKQFTHTYTLDINAYADVFQSEFAKQVRTGKEASISDPAPDARPSSLHSC